MYFRLEVITRFVPIAAELRGITICIKKFPAHDVNRIKNVLRKLPAFPVGMDAKKMVGTKNIYRVRVGITGF